MTCATRSRSSATMLLLAACLSAAVPVRSLAAQASTPPSPASTTDVLSPYRVPRIALVLGHVAGADAAAGGSVPQDRPVVVFRFAAGEPDDPLDVRSFVVAVDGADRTALFWTTVTPAGGQAWGPLADDEAVRRGQLAAGMHRVVARICSTRGACATADAQVLVVPGLTAVTAASAGATTDAPRSATRRVLGAVLSVTRKLLLP